MKVSICNKEYDATRANSYLDVASENEIRVDVSLNGSYALESMKSELSEFDGSFKLSTPYYTKEFEGYSLESISEEFGDTKTSISLRMAKKL